ncbi:SPASM domain-containing protein [bacterium]|nr:SPASM domain-containing protein [bacterium]
MECSQFNIQTQVPDQDIWLIFNTLTGSLDAIQGEKEFQAVNKTLKNISALSSSSEFLAANDRFIKSFVSKGYLVESLEKEWRDVMDKRLRMKMQGDTDHFEIYIVPTLSCNFKCSYCFLNRSPTGSFELTADTEEALIRYIERKCRDRVHLKINWYGGEPTLRIPRMARILKRIRNTMNGLTISNLLYTNGFNLNEDTICYLNDIAIDGILLTFHSDIALKDPTIYRVIRNNLKTIRRNFNGDISFRFMASDSNYPDLVKVMDDFLQEGAFIPDNPHMEILIHSVRDSEGRFTGHANLGQFSAREYAKLQIALHRDLFNRGLLNEYDIVRPAFFCGMHDRNKIGVSSDGVFFRCSEEVGIPGSSLPYGSIHDVCDIEVTNPEYQEILEWEVPQACRSCVVLPFCFGGCIKHSVRGFLNCRPEKFNLEERVQLRYQFLENKKQENKKHHVNLPRR